MNQSIHNWDHSLKNILIVRIDKKLNAEKIYVEGDLCRQIELDRQFLVSAIEKLGQESCEAQQLRHPITSRSKFCSQESSNDTIFLLISMDDDNHNPIAKGLIRAGQRSLYFATPDALRHFPDCYCVLDFYARNRRQGYGKCLFETLLKTFDAKPGQIAYDRPSSSMLSFLRRHYQLDRPLWQHNHFVIFSNFFQVN